MATFEWTASAAEMWKEKKLIRKLRARDEDAFCQLVEHYQHRIYNVIFQMLQDSAEAEDVAQEVFVSVYKHIDGFRGESKFSTWLYRIATNHARNRLKYHARRSRKRHEGWEDAGHDLTAHHSEFSADIADPHQSVVGRELEEIIRDGLANASEDHREVLILRDIENLSYLEIAQITGLTEGTVKSRLFRARLALKEYVESRYDGESI